jgi:hypothetical protein
MRPVLQLHRPWAPDPLAESIQVVHAAHGLAQHRSVAVRMRASTRTSPAEVLRLYGLAGRAGLDLGVLPTSGTACTVAFWAAVARWWLRHSGRGIALARTPRYAQRLLRADPNHRLVLEVHGLGDPLLPKLLGACRGVVTNSEGTARGVRDLGYHGPVAVLPNASRGEGPDWQGPGEGVGYVGSVRANKGLEVLVGLSLQTPVVVVTPDVAAARQLGGSLRVEAAVCPAEVPARLARFRCIVVPVGPGRFGEQETCPLKLFDALASGRPVVVADSPVMRGIAPDWVPRYAMGDLTSLCAAIDAATREPLLSRFRDRPAVTTWDQRGDALHRFLGEVCP